MKKKPLKAPRLKESDRIYQIPVSVIKINLDDCGASQRTYNDQFSDRLQALWDSRDLRCELDKKENDRQEEFLKWFVSIIIAIMLGYVIGQITKLIW